MSSSNYCFLTLGVVPFCAILELHLPHLVQVTLILTSQIPLQQEVNDARKGRGIKDQIANIRWIMEKARVFQKISISVLLTMPKPLIVWVKTNSGKFFKRWEYQTTLPAS